MTKAFRFVAARLSEVSTWKGIFMLLTAAGVTLRPEMQSAIITLGFSLVGLLNLPPDPAPSAPPAE